MSTTNTKSNSKSKTNPHIVVYPFPSSGHIIPILDLTHRLLTRGFTITFLVTPENHPLLQPILSTNHSSSSSSPSPLHPLIIPKPDIPFSTPNRLFVIIRTMLETHRPILLNWFHSHPSPPVAIISDFFLGWTNDLASELGIRRVLFSPSGAFALSVESSLWRDCPQNDKGNDDFLVSFPNIPNSPVYPWWQLSHLYRNSREGDPFREFYKTNYLTNMASWGFVFNSFAELEQVYFDHIEKEIGGHERVWAVGPVLPTDDDDSVGRGGTSSLPSDNVMTWLKSRQDESVVYVCFGSRATLTSAQIQVLTSALEQSQVQFILCVRQSTKKENEDHNDEAIPDGFEDRVRERGFVIKGWAPQVAILRHRAVGAFLTHCGWNSVLEGVASGVVMLAWPMGADQYTNAKLLVDQLGVGVRVGEGTQVIPESTQLALALINSLDENKIERARVRKLRDEALDAVRSNGSSNRDLDEFVKCLNEL